MRFTWKIAISICCGFLVCGLVVWQGYRLKTRARGTSRAVEACRLRAEQGDSKAELDLGKMCFFGTGIQQDYAEAFRWVRKAADRGFAPADSALGSWYYHGLGVTQDYNEAFRWYSAAAGKGDAAGEYGLGYMYRHGLGTKQDDQSGIGWIRKSAEQGYARAECELAYLYRKGYGLPQDYAQAAVLYRRAADQGDAEAESGIGFMEFYGYGVAENRRDATLWFHKAAEQGDQYARSALGIVFLGMSTTQLIFLVTQIVGGLLLLVGSLLSQQNQMRFRSRTAPLAGFLCLISAGIWWYGYNHYAIRLSNGGLNVFTLLKYLLGAVTIALLVRVLRGEKKRQSQG